jgi:pyrroloquinoline-quinone synthase
VIRALEFKTDVLWVQLDALWGAYVASAIPPGAWRPGEGLETRESAA